MKKWQGSQEHTDKKDKNNGRLPGGQKVHRVLVLAMAFAGAYGISYLMNLRGSVPFSYSIWTLCLWGGLAALLGHMLQGWQLRDQGRASRRHIRFAALISLCFGVLLTAGYQLQWLGYTEPGYRGKGALILRGCCVGLAVLPFADALLIWAEKLQRTGIHTERGGSWSAEQHPRVWKPAFVYLGSFLGIWLCWIPVWLAYYPTIMSYDFHKQSLEALLGPRYFNNHHPLAHTWLIYVFRNLGERLGSYETGFACFCLLQQLVVAAVLGYACVMVYRLTGRKWTVVLAGLFFGLFPLVSVFVMCTTKDVLFGAFFVLFMLLFAERTFFAEGRRRNLVDALWVAAGILMMLFRNNALYAMVVFGVCFVLLSQRKERFRALLLAVLLLAGAKGALLGLQYGFQAHSGSAIEKYSVIYQSMARVGKMQRANLDAETYELLDTYVTDECWEDYNPPLADTIKASVQQINFNQKKSWDDLGQVLSAWLRIGIKYPNEYIDAFLDLTRGYWFLDDTSHAEMLGVGAEERMGLLYTYNSAAEESLPGMQHISKLPWLETKLESLLSDNCYYRCPVLSNLMKPALWCWLLVLCAVAYLYTGQRKKVLTALYPLAYFATMLLGPTAIVRYVFPFILLMPVLLALLCFTPREN